MAGLSDYLAQAVFNFMTGNSPMPALASRYLALFTAAPTADAGTGGTEVSGTGYARVQVAGALAAAATFTTSSTTESASGASVTLTATQMLAILSAVTAFLQSTFTVLAAVLAAINVGTITTKAQVDTPPAPVAASPVNS